MNDTAIDPGPQPHAEHVDDLDELDEEWLQATAKKSRSRTILIALLAASLVFLGGVLVQRNFGSTESSSTTPDLGALSGGFPGGGEMPEGFPNLSQLGGGQGMPGASGAAQPDGSDSAADDTTAVIGKITSIKGDVWTVEDLGGKKHRVTINDDTTLTTSLHNPKEPAIDTTVTVEGTESEGDLAADSIQIR